jgi:hypothetical protein
VTRNISGSKYLAACCRKYKNLSLRTNGKQRRNAEFQRQSATHLTVDRAPPEPTPVKSEAAGGGGLKGQTLQAWDRGETMGQQMDLLIDQSTWVPVPFRSSPVRSIQSRNYTRQRSPISHRVIVKYRNHTQIPKNHPLDREKTHFPVSREFGTAETGSMPTASATTQSRVCGDFPEACETARIGGRSDEWSVSGTMALWGQRSFPRCCLWPENSFSRKRRPPQAETQFESGT